jgi:predicted  nucleic acid-binding Zn-ribbon protein
MLQDRKAYETKLDAQLAQWKGDLAVLRARTRRVTINAMVQGDQALDALQRKFDEAGSRLGSLKSATDELWENVKKDTDKVWIEFKALAHGPASKN